MYLLGVARFHIVVVFSTKSRSTCKGFLSSFEMLMKCIGSSQGLNECFSSHDKRIFYLVCDSLRLQQLGTNKGLYCFSDEQFLWSFKWWTIKWYYILMLDQGLAWVSLHACGIQSVLYLSGNQGTGRLNIRPEPQVRSH